MTRPPRGTLIVFALLIAFVVGRYFGWLPDPTPVLAPGIQ
jgi:hypothetical protein